MSQGAQGSSLSQELQHIHDHIINNSEVGIPEFVSFLRRRQADDSDSFDQLGTLMHEAQVYQVRYQEATEHARLLRANPMTDSERIEVISNVLKLWESVAQHYGLPPAQPSPDQLLSRIPRRLPLIGGIVGITLAALLILIVVLLPLYLSIKTTPSKGSLTTPVSTPVITAPIAHTTPPPILKTIPPTAPTPTTPPGVATPTPVAVRYDWNLQSDCSDSQGVVWSRGQSTGGATCSENTMAITATNQNNCGGGVICAGYNLFSLPGGQTFSPDFTVTVNIALESPSSSILSDCGVVNILYAQSGDGYLFKICSDGNGEIYAFENCQTGCQGTDDKNLPSLVPPSNQLTLSIQSQRGNFLMKVTSGTFSNTVNKPNMLYSAQTPVGLGLETLGVLGSGGNAITATFQSFSYVGG